MTTQAKGTEVMVREIDERLPVLHVPRGIALGDALAVLAQAEQFADKLASSQFVPKLFRDHPGDVMAAVMFGQCVGLHPLQALQSIAVINGRPCLWGDGALAIVRSHPDFEDIIETLERGTTDEDQRAVCVVKRRGQTPTERTFSVAAAKKAGLWGKSGPWQQYPQRMLQMRARGFAIRDAFPDALVGMVLREEAEDSEPIDVTPEPARTRPTTAAPKTLADVVEREKAPQAAPAPATPPPATPPAAPPAPTPASSAPTTGTGTPTAADLRGRLQIARRDLNRLRGPKAFAAWLDAETPSGFDSETHVWGCADVERLTTLAVALDAVIADMQPTAAGGQP